MTAYAYDTEFLEDGRTIDLISIGIVAADGREYYAVNSDAPWDRIRKHDWLMRNVVPYLPMTGRKSLDAYLKQPSTHHPRPSVELVGPDLHDPRVKPRWVIANEVRDFLLAAGAPELWADYAAYDHVVLCQLWGPMVCLPKGIPMFTRDLQQARAGRDLPPQEDGEHDALADARHVMDCLRHLGIVGAESTARGAR